MSPASAYCVMICRSRPDPRLGWRLNFMKNDLMLIFAAYSSLTSVAKREICKDLARYIFAKKHKDEEKVQAVLFYYCSLSDTQICVEASKFKQRKLFIFTLGNNWLQTTIKFEHNTSVNGDSQDFNSSTWLPIPASKSVMFIDKITHKTSLTSSHLEWGILKCWMKNWYLRYESIKKSFVSSKISAAINTKLVQTIATSSMKSM